MATHKNRNPKPKLGEELIYNILTRLPVKSVLKFRSVCKSWLYLTSTPDFIKSHAYNNDNHHLLLRYFFPNFYFETSSIHTLLNEGAVTEKSIQIDCPMVDIGHLTYVVGSCNGLVCLVNYDDDSILLWNPTTKKAKILPKCEIIIEPWDTRNAFKPSTTYGFCYDKFDDDYKVFAIFGCYIDKYGVSVYSLKCGCWRMIGEFPFGRVLYGGEFANGAMHWVVGYEFKWTIVSLDIKTEKYEKVSQPNYGEEGAYDLTLGTFLTSLSILCNFGDIYADFWVMNERGAQECWTKLFTVPCLDGLSDYQYLKPLCITANGDILLNLKSRIILYNSKDDTYKDLFDSGSDELVVHAYVESLVSPHGLEKAVILNN